MVSNVSRITFQQMSQTKLKAVFQIPECTILNDLERLLESEMRSDITLKTRDGNLRAHKAILMARSPVFAAMFNADMQEKNSDSVTIYDTSCKTLHEVLRFIYTGKRPGKDVVTTDLFVTADKYSMQRLKYMCAESLSSRISTDVAAEMLALGDRHTALLLKTEAMRFILAHAREVMQTEGWKVWVEGQPHLVAEVIQLMADLISRLTVSGRCSTLEQEYAQAVPNMTPGYGTGYRRPYF